MTNERRFLQTWLTCLIALGALVVLVNLLVDPYDVFGTPRIAGISALKPTARDHSMMTKTYQVSRAHPATVVIGSSVVYLGIDAFDPAWPAAMEPIYNYGIPGGYATSASLRTLQEAISAGGVRNAVVFLDFQNFLVAEHQSGVLTEDDRRFRFSPDGGPNPYHPAQMARDMFLSLATMGALTDSITTVISQGRQNVLNLAPDGSSTEADFVNAAHADGMHDLFTQKNAFEVVRADRLARGMAAWNGPMPNLDIIDAMIRFSQAHDVRLTLVIAPHHVDALEIYYTRGLWPRIEQVKTELAALVAARGKGVTLWDFMDYSFFATESVPEAGDRRTQTRWFWEPTHFKKQLGDLMIRRMFGSDAPAFGTELTPENVAARNARIRGDREALVCGRKPLVLTALETRSSNGCPDAQQPHGPT